ncbi:Mov34/MPN/PAD-1 family protein [Staphylococcus simulans]|uniref:Mov34/MPN/PAD-1 family protein n=1 Tax=Staphylococcus simulans TaxID=1286 RepID=UPI000D1EB4C1|nr:Mov34/MPN/PAD-1 family protein [Staphylococcus simulans]MDY5060455.1 Mov34/MPN/PAD-1 family protein [Staphylococcus simulans]PTJ20237.1 hypothetical protein BU038_01990 [Staphylococcus simulans]
MIKFKVGSILVEINDEVEQEMYKYRQVNKEMNEAGGILQGLRLKNGNLVVTNLTTPQPGDIQTRNFYKKNKEYHQQISDDIWNNTNRTTVCIGEWHTHPEKTPIVSTLDLDSWKNNVLIQKSENIFIFVIVGITNIKVWGKTINKKIIEGELLEK